MLVEDEVQSMRSPLIHSPPDARETFFKLAECSRNNQGNKEIMEMLVSMKKEMEEKMGTTTENQGRIHGG